MPQPRGTRVRYTRQAAALVAVMAGMPAFSDARDIREAVRRAGGRVGLATVYRHLHVLAEQGSVDTMHGPGGQVLYRRAAAASPTTSPAGPAGERPRSTGTRSGNWPATWPCWQGSPSPGTRSSWPACAPPTLSTRTTRRQREPAGSLTPRTA